MSDIQRYCIAGHQIFICLNGDWYGDDYYRRAESGDWEPETIDFLRRNLGSGSKFLDIGAATGLLSIFGQKLGAEVLAVEPIPQAYSLLRKNLSLNLTGGGMSRART